MTTLSSCWFLIRFWETSSLSVSARYFSPLNVRVRVGVSCNRPLKFIWPSVSFGSGVPGDHDRLVYLRCL